MFKRLIKKWLGIDTLEKQLKFHQKEAKLVEEFIINHSGIIRGNQRRLDKVERKQKQYAGARR